MSTTIIRLVFCALFFMTFLGCSQESPDVNKIDGASTFSKYKKGGASSGGGNYSQQPTHQMLEIAKLSLSETISNLPEEFFADFPEEYKRDTIVEIIKNIRFEPQKRTIRDGSYIKMDYDKNTNTLVATYDFYVIYNFPSLLSLIKKPEKFREELANIQIDILHEFSHLLKIGDAVDTNFTSELFAGEFLGTMQSVRYICDNDQMKMAFYPYKKVFLLEKINTSNSFSFINHLAEMYPGDADVEEFFETEELTNERLANGSEFWQDFEINLLSNYLMDPKVEGSVSSWEESIINFYDLIAKENEPNSSVFGFTFDTSKSSHEFESQILDIGRVSSNGSEVVGFGEYRQKLLSHLKFNSDYSKASWTYDLKVEFVDELTDKQKENLSTAKKDRGEINFSEEFECKKIVPTFPVKPFLLYPMNTLNSPNMKKLRKALREINPM